MSIFRIKKGRDLKITGVAEKKIEKLDLPQTVGIQPSDFRGLKPRLAVKEGDTVKVGTPILTDKEVEGLQLVSSASGTVKAITRGEKRALIEIVIELDGKQETENFTSYSETDLKNLSEKDIKGQLLKAGLWPVLRQRPFSKISNPQDKPKSIFVHAMSTEPLALDVDAVMSGCEKDFQVGLDLLKKLTDGSVHVCMSSDAKSDALTKPKNVELHQFSGAHPAGNVSTHIYNIDPIQKGEIVWYLEAWDVVRIGRLFLTGAYSTEKFVAVTGDAATKRYYAQTIEGVSLETLLKDVKEPARYITGSVLTGRQVAKSGFVGFYDSQVTVILEGGKRELLGWIGLGLNKYSFTRTNVSALTPNREFSLDTDKNGADRAIVLNHIYDDLNALDIPVYFLLRAIIAGEIDECEKFGILECDEEDFALCTFACPSKTNVGEIIRHGLEVIEKEG